MINTLRRLIMKTLDLSLGIILILGHSAIRIFRIWRYFHEDLFGRAVVTVLGSATLFGGGFMIWLSSR
jgi:hypothetical protein